MRPTLSILMPVRNEGINLCIMLKLLRPVLNVPYEVLIVCDSKEDRTFDLLSAQGADLTDVRLIYNNRGKGIINALQEGVAQARGTYVLLFAADEVGPVLAIDDMLDLMNRGCDLVSCTRYAYGGRRLGGSFIGGLLSKLANNAFRPLSGTQLTDCTTGIKMFDREKFMTLRLESKPIGWAVAFEIAVKAQLAGFRLGEVPIISIDRLYGGESTFRLGPWTVEYLRWFLWGVWSLRKHRGLGTPMRPTSPAWYRGIGGQVKKDLAKGSK